MKTTIFTQEQKKTVLMFHIGRGGRFHNQGHLTFEGIQKITDCHDWAYNTFLHDTDGDETLLPEDEWKLSDGGGNELMNGKELQTALSTGIGSLDFDGGYDTTYTTYLEELSEKEFTLIDSDLKRAYLVLVCGFDEEKLNKIGDDKLDGLYNGDEGWFRILYEEVAEEGE
ncbi:MAG: hypothetical protein FWF54_00420 [Candidatus Azobacteroides sp.]|nr:hypothetical protein [Candidatus Azobacteroides sp.]